MSINKADNGSPQSFHAEADLVSAYKTLFKEILDRRPSGTRRRLAVALGKNPSFISQISNPVYPVPVPPSHIDTLFQICHFSDTERSQFIRMYRRAHPGRLVEHHSGSRQRKVSFKLPDLGDPDDNARLDQIVKEFVERIGDLVAANKTKK